MKVGPSIRIDRLGLLCVLFVVFAVGNAQDGCCRWRYFFQSGNYVYSNRTCPDSVTVDCVETFLALYDFDCNPKYSYLPMHKLSNQLVGADTINLHNIHSNGHCNRLFPRLQRIVHNTTTGYVMRLRNVTGIDLFPNLREVILDRPKIFCGFGTIFDLDQTVKPEVRKRLHSISYKALAPHCPMPPPPKKCPTQAPPKKKSEAGDLLFVPVALLSVAASLFSVLSTFS